MRSFVPRAKRNSAKGPRIQLMLAYLTLIRLQLIPDRLLKPRFLFGGLSFPLQVPGGCVCLSVRRVGACFVRFARLVCKL